MAHKKHFNFFTFFGMAYSSIDETGLPFSMKSSTFSLGVIATYLQLGKWVLSQNS